MKKLTRMFFAFALPLLLATTAPAVEGVKGVTVRPAQEKAKVEGCKVAKPGDYEIAVGDLIELDYTYPIVPTALPNKAEFTITLIGAVVGSPIGTRLVTTPKMVGASTIAFYFDAKKEGEDTVTLKIDTATYVYNFKVVKK
jgi:hypothetical protein